jgi:hypothetical protein
MSKARRIRKISVFTCGGKFPVLTMSYINTALSQSAFRIYKCYIIKGNNHRIWLLLHVHKLMLSHFQFHIVCCTSPCSTVITRYRVSWLAVLKLGIPPWYLTIRPITPLHPNVPNLGICIPILERLSHFMGTEDVSLYGYTVWQVCGPYVPLFCFCCSSVFRFCKRLSGAK